MEPSVIDVSNPGVSMSPRRRAHLPGAQELGLIVVIAVMWTVLTIAGYVRADPGHRNLFLNPDNLINNVATPMSIYSIMAIGMTMVIISGGIDISVASMMALSATTAAAVLQNFPPDAPSWQVLPVALLLGPLVGMACGLVNGMLVTLLDVHPFIVTLGTLGIFRCAVMVGPSVATLPNANLKLYLPDAFNDMMLMKVADLKMMPLFIMLIVGAVGWFYLSQTVGGREIYAVGGNEEAARFSGLRTKAIKLRVYAIAGFTAGIAGTVNLGRFGATSANTAYGYELDVVAAAVVGGASLLGGRGTALGAMLGMLVIATIWNGISIMNFSDKYRMGIVGSAIILAVTVDRFSEILRRRRFGVRRG